MATVAIPCPHMRRKREASVMIPVLPVSQSISTFTIVVAGVDVMILDGDIYRRGGNHIVWLVEAVSSIIPKWSSARGCTSFGLVWFEMTISSPVCSSAPCSSTSSPPFQIMPNGGIRSFYLAPKDFECSYDLKGKRFLRLSTDRGLQRVAFRVQALKDPTEFMGNGLEQTVRIPPLDARDGSYNMGTLHMQSVQNTEVPAPDPDVVFNDFAEQSVVTGLTSLESVDTERVLAFDEASKVPDTLPEPLSVDNDLLSGLKSSINGSSGFNGFSSINEAIEKVENIVRSTYDSAVSYVDAIFKRATTTIESSVDQIGTSAANRYTNFSSDIKEAANQAAATSIDALRSTVVVLEDSLTKGASFIVYSYNTSKELLPLQFRESLIVFEEKANEFRKPVGVAGQQVYLAVEQLERVLGLNPNDPLVSFLLFLGTTSAFWALYWAWTYGGYSGDLSPKLTLEILMGQEGAALIDVRPEVLRETQGIPDLRRTARFHYSSASLPEVNGSLRSLVTSQRDLEDSLTAVVISNMKIVQDRSKVILIDGDGSRAKGIARALTKLGIKRSYLVQGGFQSWVKEGLRIKELKTETALTVLNEEAEAILAEINPSPLQLVAYGLGLLAAIYSIIEWETTLQLIGIVGVGQTIFRRVGSYENLDDIKDDLRLLGVPAKLGAQAFSWAAGKLETNGLKLPTSPSSSDVQSRVLQAAAKHESQPSDDVQKTGLTQESISPGGEGAEA